MPFNQTAADTACNYFEKVLKHTADDWWGQPFILAPWQEEAVSEIFGQLDDDGNRKISVAYLEIPKKNGKTELTAGLVLLVLDLDKNPGCQVYRAAAYPSGHEEGGELKPFTDPESWRSLGDIKTFRAFGNAHALNITHQEDGSVALR